MSQKGQWETFLSLNGILKKYVKLNLKDVKTARIVTQSCDKFTTTLQKTNMPLNTVTSPKISKQYKTIKTFLASTPTSATSKRLQSSI